MKRITLVTNILAATVLMISFQNCGKTNTLRNGVAITDPVEVFDDPQGTSVGVVMEPQTSPLPTTPPQPRISYVIPRVIEFGYIADNWYYYGGPPVSLPRDPITGAVIATQRPLDRYAYELSLSNGKVTDKDTGDLLWDLTAEQKKKLKAILSGTVIAYPSYFLGPNAGNYACPAMWVAPYANLVTNRGGYELGSGSPGCARDLYKRTTGQSAGLREFLEDIEAEFGLIGIAVN